MLIQIIDTALCRSCIIFKIRFFILPRMLYLCVFVRLYYSYFAKITNLLQRRYKSRRTQTNVFQIVHIIQTIRKKENRKVKSFEDKDRKIDLFTFPKILTFHPPLG